MLINRFILLCAFPLLIVGCATTSDSQDPVPVYKNGVKVQNKPPLPTKVKKIKKAKSKAVQSSVLESNKVVIPENVEIKPLGDSTSSGPKIQELAPEPLTPEQQSFIAEQNALSLSQASQGAKSVEGQAPLIVLDDVNGAVVIEKKPEAPVSVVQPFEPLDTFTPFSPAVNALVLSANRSSQSGNIEVAMTTLERAIRIEPRNPTLYYKLALLKLKTSRAREAEDLAKKAALLGGNDVAIKKHSWLLIAKSRELQGNVEGANEARVKANGF